jgi:hypothetical protein
MEGQIFFVGFFKKSSRLSGEDLCGGYCNNLT